MSELQIALLLGFIQAMPLIALLVGGLIGWFICAWQDRNKP